MTLKMLLRKIKNAPKVSIALSLEINTEVVDDYDIREYVFSQIL